MAYSNSFLMPDLQDEAREQYGFSSPLLSMDYDPRRRRAQERARSDAEGQLMALMDMIRSSGVQQRNQQWAAERALDEKLGLNPYRQRASSFAPGAIDWQMSSGRQADPNLPITPYKGANFSLADWQERLKDELPYWQEQREGSVLPGEQRNVWGNPANAIERVMRPSRVNDPDYFALRREQMPDAGSWGVTPEEETAAANIKAFREQMGPAAETGLMRLVQAATREQEKRFQDAIKQAQAEANKPIKLPAAARNDIWLKANAKYPKDIDKAVILYHQSLEDLQNKAAAALSGANKPRPETRPPLLRAGGGQFGADDFREIGRSDMERIGGFAQPGGGTPIPPQYNFETGQMDEPEGWAAPTEQHPDWSFPEPLLNVIRQMRGPRPNLWEGPLDVRKDPERMAAMEQAALRLAMGASAGPAVVGGGKNILAQLLEKLGRKGSPVKPNLPKGQPFEYQAPARPDDLIGKAFDPSRRQFEYSPQPDIMDLMGPAYNLSPIQRLLSSGQQPLLLPQRTAQNARQIPLNIGSRDPLIETLLRAYARLAENVR